MEDEQLILANPDAENTLKYIRDRHKLFHSNGFVSDPESMSCARAHTCT